MKASIYQKSDATYLAIMESGQKITRGNPADLASALRDRDVPTQNMFFGDWGDDASLLSKFEQRQLMELTTSR